MSNDNSSSSPTSSSPPPPPSSTLQELFKKEDISSSCTSASSSPKSTPLPLPRSQAQAQIKKKQLIATPGSLPNDDLRNPLLRADEKEQSSHSDQVNGSSSKDHQMEAQGVSSPNQREIPQGKGLVGTNDTRNSDLRPRSDRSLESLRGYDKRDGGVRYDKRSRDIRSLEDLWSYTIAIDDYFSNMLDEELKKNSKYGENVEEGIRRLSQVEGRLKLLEKDKDNSADKRRVSALTILLLALTVLGGFSSAIYMTRSCNMTKFQQTVITVISFLGVLSFALMALLTMLGCNESEGEQGCCTKGCCCLYTSFIIPTILAAGSVIAFILFVYYSYCDKTS